MKYFKTISLVLAGALLLLHSLVAHKHHSELDEATHVVQHEEADDLYDYLQLIFHIDMGGDHLKDYKNVNFTFISPDFFDSSILEITYYLIQSDQFQVEFILDNSIPRICGLQFRGPPTLA